MRPSQIRIERLNQRIAYQSINATQITRMITRIAIKLITFYQYCLSMLIGSQCRFYPTCSQYTKEAIETHGLLKGFYLGSRRLARCHPWHEGGFDPVPGTPALTDTQDIFPDK